MSDPFSAAQSGFLEMSDFEGRTVLFVPKSTEKRKSTMRGQEGKMVDVIMADVIICDGPPTEKIDQIPMISNDFMVWSQVVCGQLRPKLGRKNADGSPAMVAGRLIKKPAPDYGPDSKSWNVDGDAGQWDVQAARRGAAAYLAEQNSVKADDPFAVV